MDTFRSDFKSPVHRAGVSKILILFLAALLSLCAYANPEIIDVASQSAPETLDSESLKYQFELELLEAKIASLSELVGLHEAKISALQASLELVPDEPEKTRINEKGERVKVGKQAGKKNAIIDPARLEYYEYFKRKQNVDKTDYETQISLLNEKVEYRFGDQVRTFEFINVKSIHRASQGFMVQMAVAVALPGGRIKVIDIYGNDLIEF